MEARHERRCPVACVSPHSSQNCLRCAQDRLRAPPALPTHSIHIGSPYSKGKYVLHEEEKPKKRDQRRDDDEKMCISSVTQIAYGIIMVVCLGLTLTALFTPGWRKFSDDVKKDLATLQIPAQQGILPYACRMPDDSSTVSPSSSSSTSTYCDAWWQNLQGWEKTVIICMVAAVVAEVACLAWNAFTCCACCCKKYLIHPLTPLSIIVTALLCATVVIYGINNKDFFGQLRQAAGQTFSTVNLENTVLSTSTTEVGYSFWLAVGALVLAAIDTVVAIVTVFFGERCC